MKKFFLATFLSAFFAAENIFACAHGCSIFNVATSSLIPNCPGGLAFLEYDYMNQNQNWQKEKHASASENHDKKIKSQLVTAGMQYMFDRKWGAAIRLPYMTRQTKIMSEEGEINSTRTNSLGDVRINGIYSGFSSDMSSGITFGLKLPTGETNARGLERNIQIGTGSTDLILGAYKIGKINAEKNWNYFVQTSWDHPFIRHRGYNPGDEISAATGIYFNARSVAGKKITPIFQVTGSKKMRDSGWTSNSFNSGYSQAYFAPALEINFGKIRTYADIELPFYQNVNGNQLVPTRIYKVILGYNF